MAFLSKMLKVFMNAVCCKSWGDSDTPVVDLVVYKERLDCFKKFQQECNFFALGSVASVKSLAMPGITAAQEHAEVQIYFTKWKEVASADFAKDDEGKENARKWHFKIAELERVAEAGAMADCYRQDHQTR